MGQTTIERRKDNLIVYRLRQLEQDVVALKANQLQELQFGNLLLTSLQQTGAILANGNSIVTGSGLSPLANFPIGGVVQGGGTNTTSTSYVDVPGSTLSPFTTTGPNTQALVLFIVGAEAGNFLGDGSQVGVQLVDSVGGAIISTDVQQVWHLTGLSGFNWTQQGSSPFQVTNISWGSGLSAGTTQMLVTIPAIISFSQGVHTLKLQYKVVGTGTAFMDFFYIDYIIIGQQQT